MVINALQTALILSISYLMYMDDRNKCRYWKSVIKFYKNNCYFQIILVLTNINFKVQIKTKMKFYVTKLESYVGGWVFKDELKGCFNIC